MIRQGFGELYPGRVDELCNGESEIGISRNCLGPVPRSVLVVDEAYEGELRPLTWKRLPKPLLMSH